MEIVYSQRNRITNNPTDETNTEAITRILRQVGFRSSYGSFC